MKALDGFLVVDKTEGMTSHDVVSRMRRLLKTRAIGHLGTLDPMATGVLPLAVGKATRLIQYVPGFPKVYEGTMRLGFSTSTYDREGEPTSHPVAPDVSSADLEQACREMLGRQHQLPPPFSAKKIDGVRSYKMARQGRAVKLQPQAIKIERLELLKRSDTEVDFEICCSPGTYVRSVAHDLGQKWGCGAHLIRLRRTVSGQFSLKQAVTLEYLEPLGLEEMAASLLPMAEAIAFLPPVTIPAELESLIGHGRDFSLPAEAQEIQFGSPVRMMSASGELLGLAERLPTTAPGKTLLTFHPKMVLQAAEPNDKFEKSG